MKLFIQIVVILEVLSYCSAAPAVPSSPDGGRSIDEILALTGNMRHGAVNPNAAFGPSGRLSPDGRGRLTEYDIMELIEAEEVKNFSTPNAGSVVTSSNVSRRNKRSAINGASYRWPNAVIPYTFTSQILQYSRDLIMQAIEEYNKYTCIRWIPRTTESNYVEFQDDPNSSGCWSYVGRIGGKQNINLLQGNPGCTNALRTPVHEMLHAAGVYHQQSRTDRNSFVSIAYANIQAGYEHNFDIATNTDFLGVPYDYRSVMHYSRTAFSRNGQDTIVTTDPAFQSVIGYNPTLSYRDIHLANVMYGCAAQASCPPVTCPSGSYQAHDCNCYCSSGAPNNPIEYCGQVCTVPDSPCSCSGDVNSCSGIPNSSCNSGTDACECDTGYVEFNGACTLASSITCTEVNVNCKCTLDAAAKCNGLANTVCDSESDACICDSGFAELAGACVDVNSVSCNAADSQCFCESKGATACNGVPESSCDPNTGACVCNEDYYNNGGTCSATPACTSLNSPCLCQLQGADGCSGLANSICNADTGACVCSALNPEVGGVCLDSLKIDGSSLAPFTMVAGSDVNYVPTAGSDNNAWEVPTNGYYLNAAHQSGKSHAVMEYVLNAPGQYCFRFGIYLNDARVIASFTTHATTYSYGFEYTGDLGGYYNWGLNYIPTETSLTVRIDATGVNGRRNLNWFTRVDPITLFAC